MAGVRVAGTWAMLRGALYVGWVLVVGVALVAVLRFALVGRPLSHIVAVSWLPVVLWLVWAAAFLFGAARRKSTVALLGRVKRV